MTASDAWLLAPLARFYAAAARALPVVETVGDEDVPGPLRELLRAPRPLTPRLEHLHGETLALRVLERRRDGDVYARRVVLVRSDEVPVVLGAIEIDLARLSAAMRESVLAETVPFGHIFGEATAEPDALFRIACDAGIAEALALARPDAWLYGRRRTLGDASGVTVASIVEILAPDSPRHARAERTGS
jgi:chorismate-pyruvate lyase